MSLFKATPEHVQRISSLRPEQESLLSNQLSAIQGPGAGGAFGQSADYFRDILGGGGTDQFEAPLMRQFKEDIMPSIAEQFAGMGAGGLSSGGFAQESGRAATDLGERLGNIRAGLRQNAAQSLMNFGNQGLTPRDEALFVKRQPSLFENFATELLPPLAATALGGPAAGAATALSSFLKK